MGETTMMKTALAILLLAAFAAALPGEETSYDPAAVVAEQAPDMEQKLAEISVDENAGNHRKYIQFLLMHLRAMQNKLRASEEQLRASEEKVKNLEEKVKSFGHPDALKDKVCPPLSDGSCRTSSRRRKSACKSRRRRRCSRRTWRHTLFSGT